MKTSSENNSDNTIPSNETLDGEKVVVDLVDEKEEQKKKTKKNKRSIDGTINRGVKSKAKPTLKQKAIFNRILGSPRWVWNWALEKYEENVKKDKNHKFSLKETSKELTLLKQASALAYRESLGIKIKTKKNISEEDLIKQKNKEKLLKNIIKNKENILDYNWLNFILDTVLRQSLKDLDESFNAYYDGKYAKRRDKPGLPKFKSKANDESATFQVDSRLELKSSCINNENQIISIPGIVKNHKNLKFIKTKEIVGELSSFVLSRKNNKYYISLSMINIDKKTLKQSFTSNSKFVNFPFESTASGNPTCDISNPEKEGLIAIDAALKWGGIATQDNKSCFKLIDETERDRALQKENNTKKYQRAQSRKIEAKYAEYGIKREEGGEWPKDAGKILAEKVKERNLKHKEKRKKEIEENKFLSHDEKQKEISNIKDEYFVKSKRQLKVEEKYKNRHTLKTNYLTDAIHKATTKIIRENHTIVLETLDIKAMMEDEEKSPGFRKSVANTCLSEIRRQLVYKAKWYDRNIIFTDQWFASSKLCSTVGCNYKNKDLKLSDTIWTCPDCNTVHERDSNASFNLWQRGWGILDEIWQEKSTKSLVDGSSIKGPQGVVFEKISTAEEHRKLKRATSSKKKAAKNKSSSRPSTYNKRFSKNDTRVVKSI